MTQASKQPAAGEGAVVGVDVGGTFTDAVVVSGGGLTTAKVLTTPEDPAVGVRRVVSEALVAAGVAPGQVVRVVHGTTLATNVILERRGARVGFVTTEGFGDLFRLGREARVEDDRYDLRFSKPEAPVAPGHVVEAPERMTATGTVHRALDAEAAAGVAAAVAKLRPDAVAICLLHAWANPAHERLLAEAIGQAVPDAYLATSSDVWPELREYERAMTTLLSAYVGPVMAEYLGRLDRELGSIGLSCGVQVMDSAGGIMQSSSASRRPVLTIESGGAAGMAAAAQLARQWAGGLAISFDMGGTTAKAGIIRDGHPDLTHNFQVGGKGSFGVARPGTGLPVKGPVVDLAEVGAGGGSIAWVDRAGSLRVGPRSAGASPGPACYGRGGTEPTVTDANLVLGLLGHGGLADNVHLSVVAAREAIETGVAGPLGISVVDAARAIRDVAIAHMAAAIRVVTVQRGVDPRTFPLVAFGGAGPMHAALLADTFGITEVLVPWGAGVASAWGLAGAAPSVERVRTRPRPAAGDRGEGSDGVVLDEVNALLSELTADGRTELGVGAGEGVARPSIDVRYRGQSHQLTVDLGDLGVPLPDLGPVIERFHERHRAVYGMALELPCELVSFRVRLVASQEALSSVGAEGKPGPWQPAASWPAYFSGAGFVETPVWAWDDLGPGWSAEGPTIVQGRDSTVVVPEGWDVTAGDGNHLVLRRR